MDSDLPDVPSSPPLLPQTRKRPLDPEFHSDGPTFSSDPAEPAVDLTRRKRQHRGTWWAHGKDRAPKTGFTRNFDSGIFLASDSSEDSVPNDDLNVHPYKSRRLARPLASENPLDAAVAAIVDQVVEKSGDTIDMA
jgi:hypothetical protein